MSNLITIDEMISKLDSLSSERESWEQNELRKSNARLYTLLGHCADLYPQIKSSTKLRKALNKQLEKRGIQGNANASLQLKIVRWVFGDIGSKAYRYANVVSKAHQKPEKQSYVAWLEDIGGPSALAQKQQKSGGQLKRDRIDVASPHFESCTPLASLSKPVSSLQPNPNAPHDFALALVRSGSGKTPEVIFGTNNTSLVNAVLAEGGKQVKSTKQQGDTTNKSTERQKAVSDAIDALAGDDDEEDS